MRTRKINEINYKKLLDYGFILNDNIYYYEQNILSDKFKVVIEIKDDLKSKVIDNTTLDEYILVDVDSASGNYVGMVKDEYERLLLDIINTCTKKEIYKSKQLKDVLKYIKKTYKDNPEYLWKNSPSTAAIRNKKNNKWYLVIMVINSSKLGIDKNEEVEVIDIRYQKDLSSAIIDNVNIFPGWHMNKKSWISILLDGTLDNEIVYSLIDNSYDLSEK